VSNSAPWMASRCCIPSDDPKAKDRRTTQYFEMFGNRAIYHEGWVACTQFTRFLVWWSSSSGKGRCMGAATTWNEDFSEAS